MSAVTSKRAAPRLRTPAARAWRKYLRETKDVHGLYYEEKEPWMWEELQTKLDKARQVEEDDGA